MADTDNSTPLNQLYTFNPALGTFSSGAVRNGEFIEDTQVVKGLVEQIFVQQFGMEVPDPATPLGRLVEWLAINFASAMRVNVQNANQLVLSAAAGQQLDVIALWFGLYRKPAVASTVNAILRGAEGTVVPAGSRARTTEGAVFSLSEDVTIDTPANLPDGTPTFETEGVFRTVETGPIGCPADTLNAIDTPIQGWSMVFNPEDGTIGRDTETDESLRARIEASRFHGTGFIYSMKNAIEAIDGVNSSMVVENYTGEEKTIHGIPDMTPHSIFVCVDCPDDDLPAVAQAVFDQKPCGTAYHEIDSIAVEKVVSDAYGNNYSVVIHKPEDCAIRLNFVLRNRAYTGSDLEGDLESAVKDFAKAHEYKIGETVYATDILKAVESALPGIIVLSCAVTDAGTLQAGTSNAEIHSLSFLDVAAYQKADFENCEIIYSLQ